MPCFAKRRRFCPHLKRLNMEIEGIELIYGWVCKEGLGLLYTGKDGDLNKFLFLLGRN